MLKAKIFKKEKLLPMILFLGVVLFDQITKILVEINIPYGEVKYAFFGDFLQIIHVTNTGAAFSMGHSFSEPLRILTLLIFPLIVLLGLLIFYFITDEFSNFQRWALCGVLGGGFGNLIDRFFRPMGVVDFIDIKFYGLFGLERWPTFNIADSFILVCIFLLAISLFKSEKSK